MREELLEKCGLSSEIARKHLRDIKPMNLARTIRADSCLMESIAQRLNRPAGQARVYIGAISP